MILDRSHKRWLLVSLAILAIATVAYSWSSSQPGGPSGGSRAGLLFGILGSGMMVFAGLLSARRSVPTWRIGSAAFWLKGHIWLGLLSLAMILFHAGFRWGGPIEIGLWVTTLAIIVTGVVGLVLQHVLPRQLTTRVPNETFVDQLPYQCASMQFLADKAVAEVVGPLDTSARDAIGVAEEVARQRKWLKRDSDLEKLIGSIYRTAGTTETKQETATATRPTDAKPAGPKKKPAPPKRGQGDAPSKPRKSPKPRPKKEGMSVLEQARAQQAAASSGQSESDKPSTEGMSVLEQARAQQGESETEASKPANSEAESDVELTMDSLAKVHRPKRPTRDDGAEREVIRTDELLAFYLKSVRPFLAFQSHGRSALSDPVRRRSAFFQMQRELPSELHGVLDQLERFCDQRGQLHRLTRIHRWLHGWLYLHVPLSAALLVLFVVHVVVSLRVVPWTW